MAEQRFTEKEAPKTNFKEVGRSGTLVTGFIVQNDYLSELLGELGQEVYAKMLWSDSAIRKIFHAVSNPIKSATWTVEPASDETKDIEAAALIEQILFNDIHEGWTAKLDEILTFPWHGHAVFEVVHQNRSHRDFGDYTGLKNLAFRDQRTLDQWKFSREGILEFVHQTQSGEIEVDVDIPAENLIIFYNEKKGNDTGYPFCRMLYGNYKRKLLYKQLQAIGIERAAIPVPHAELPVGIDYESDEYEDVVNQLQNFSQAEQAFFVTPAGFKINYNQATTFDPSKTQVAIKAENEEIAGSLVAMWLEMGIGGNSAVGSSTSESLEFFRDGIEYLANKIVETMKPLIENLMRLNYGDVEIGMPKLTHSGIADEAGKDLMEIVTGYVKDGVIQADEPLEDHVRRVHNLPAKAEGEQIENGQAQETPDPTPPSDELELNTKKKSTPVALINSQIPKVNETLREAMQFSADKYVNDVIKRYRQLSDARKQKATDKTVIGGQARMRKALRVDLIDTSARALTMARSEVPSKRNIELSEKRDDIQKISKKYGLNNKEIKLNELSDLPAYIQVLIAKQSELITEDTLNDMKSRIDFSFSGIERSSNDENVIRQAMEDEAQSFIDSNQVNIKSTNVVALTVNESRSAFFFEDEVLEEIHSFTFMNAAPVSAVCKELAGTTFNTNDAESLRFSPPLHHNCKSWLRPNLKTSRGVDRLEVSTLSPSADARKSITL